jgi:hypothetical protein
MDTEALTAHIIHRLADAVPPGDIVLEICNKTGLSWPEVEMLVKQVQTEHEKDITKKQSPLLTMLAFGIFAGGVGLLAYAVYTIYLVTGAYTGAALNPWNLPNVFNFIFNYASYTLYAILFGVAMILGSLLGMREVWAAILNI